MDFRQLHGEQMTGESWLVRNTWEKLDRSQSHRVGMAKVPKFFGATAIRVIINDAWRIQDVRDLLDGDNGEKRHEFKATHCFRKYFETKCQLKMNHNNIKLLMDHSFGESQNYHRPIEDDLLEDYLKVVDLLTISEENRLKLKVQKLETDKVDNARLDAKIDALARQTLKTQALVYKDRPRDTAFLTLEPWEMENPAADKRRMTEEEIEDKIQWERQKRAARRIAEKKLLAEL